MRTALRLSLALLFFAGTGIYASRAEAATTADQLVALQRAGLDDDILIALIQTDGSTFQLSADDILELHRQGLSNKVIHAMQATATRRQPVVVQDVEAAPPEDATPSRAVAQPAEAPGVVNVYQTVSQHVDAPPSQSPQFYTVPVAVPVYVSRPIVPRAEPPVYWGFGGKRRPDTWDDSTTLRRDGRKAGDK
jgi:hypothetical protein